MSRSILHLGGFLLSLEGGGAGYTDDVGGAARFDNPWSVSTDGTYLFVTDHNNNRIRRIE